MTPINITTKTRKRRVQFTTRQLRKAANRKRLLDEAIREMCYDNPAAAPVVFPQTELKSCKQLVEEYLALATNLAESTRKEKARILKVFTDWLGPQPFNRDAIERFNADLSKIDWSDGMKWLIGRTLCTFLTWLADTKRIPDQWHKGIRFPKAPPQKPRPVYTPDEVAKLIDAAGDKPVGFVILLAYHTGMAIADVANLLWRNVDMEKLTITRNRQKTGVESIITVKFGSALHRALERQREDTIRAFGSCDPGLPVCRWSYQNKAAFYTLFRRLCEQCGVPYRSFHSFRATLITDMMNSGVPINVGLKISGLKSVQQMAQYASTPVQSVRDFMERIRA